MRCIDTGILGTATHFHELMKGYDHKATKFTFTSESKPTPVGPANQQKHTLRHRETKCALHKHAENAVKPGNSRTTA